jgi:alpha-L-rhamnosidase
MARYATRLGKPRTRSVSPPGRELKGGVQQKVLPSPTLGQYDNGSQTSCVLPLAFGLVPDGPERERVFNHLVEDHPGTKGPHRHRPDRRPMADARAHGNGGRADLAYTIATQKDYPSWGYMVKKGATTIWELWNGNTADPAMNSGNHVMLVGDLVHLALRDLAGIKPDPEQPGFKHIIMRPLPVGDLLRMENGRAVFNVGGGKYHFVSE